MAIWLCARRPCRYALGANPASRATGDVLDVGRTRRPARQSVTHACRVAARSRDVDRLRFGATPAGDRPPRAGDPSRRRRRAQPDPQPRNRRATPRRTPSRGAPRRPTKAPDQADPGVQTTATRLETAPQRHQAIAPQTRRRPGLAAASRRSTFARFARWHWVGERADRRDDLVERRCRSGLVGVERALHLRQVLW